MIYRLLIDNAQPVRDGETGEWIEIPRFGGPGGYRGVGVADVMRDLGLQAPRRLSHVRARFYFTQRGWNVFGRPLVRAARPRGHVAKVIRRKNPPRSQIVYRDAFQVALLPPRPRGQRRTSELFGGESGGRVE